MGVSWFVAPVVIVTIIVAVVAGVGYTGWKVNKEIQKIKDNVDE